MNGAIFQQFSAYHGALALAPSSGTILRLTLVADLENDAPIKKAELTVEYGPVELGGETYFCPVRSVSVSVAPTLGGWDAARYTVNQTSFYMTHSAVVGNNAKDRADAQLQSMLNETVFDQYHLFRADMQILTDPGSQAGGTAGAPAAATEATSTASVLSHDEAAAALPIPAPSSATVNVPAGGDVSRPAEAKKTASSAVISPQVSPPSPLSGANPEAPPSAPAATPPAQEIAVASPGDFPQTPASLPSASSPSGFALSLNSRLVDVDVTAFDKKGRPVTDLTKDDFVLNNDGRKQALRSFTPMSGAARPKLQSPAPAAAPVLYSNLSAAAGSGGSGTDESTAVSSTILLLDESSLDFADLNHARSQILKFLDRLPPSEPVGLYVRTGSEFRILARETSDHAALISALQHWKPTPSDLARAQEAERRNRQQFDYVDSPSEMQYVNGNTGGTMAPAQAPPLTTVMVNSGSNPRSDPRLMTEGQDPVHNALTALVAVAARMNAIPGHKNLIWIVSDNVLANWTDQAPGLDQGADRVGNRSLAVQEALNDAHVSLFPLDASQLETTATDASLQNDSVQLNPAVSSEYPGTSDAGAPRTGSREKAGSLQDAHAVQPAIQFMAQATGGRVFRRSDNLEGDLQSIVAQGNAAYLLSFAPDVPPDGKYHRITVTVPGRRGIRLRYREGYFYAEEPTTLKARFKQAVW
ncbi:MAG: VWA domain-containing protein, partial [Acidobacteriota bacterium]